MTASDPLLETLLAAGIKLPTPGTTLLRFQELSANDKAGPQDYARAVAHDPALTGELLRVANSPVFRARTPVRTAKAAIAQLGLTRSLAVIASSALRGQMSGVEPRILELLWAGLAASADRAYHAAQAFGFGALADTAYLTGLMHDIGIAVLLRRFPEHAALLDVPPDRLDEAAALLDEAAGASHAKVGATVCRGWKLPAEVVEAIAFHHQPAAIDQLSRQAATLAALLALARRMRDGPGPEWEVWGLYAREILGFDEGGIEELDRRWSTGHG